VGSIKIAVYTIRLSRSSKLSVVRKLFLIKLLKTI